MNRINAIPQPWRSWVIGLLLAVATFAAVILGGWVVVILGLLSLMHIANAVHWMANPPREREVR